LIRTFLLGSLLLAMTSPTVSSSASGQAPASLLPAPRTLETRAGEFRLRPDTPLVLQTGRGDLAGALDLLADLVRQGAGWDLPRGRADAPLAGSIFLGGLEADTDEAYTVDITPHAVDLRAGGFRGAVWAVQALRQLLPPELEVRRPQPVLDPGRPAGDLRALPPGHRYPRNGLAPVPRVPAPPAPAPWAPPAGGLPLPALRISDAPRFGWRGLLLDCGRHFADVPTIERLLDLMALHRLNVLHWHLTEDQGWRLEIRAYPRLVEVGAWRSDHDGVRYGGYYTQEQARHVVAYAAARGITVVPEIEMPGHSQAALAAYPELGCRGDQVAVQESWGVWPDIYCAGREEVFTFLQDVLTEVLDIFPSRFIHVGGDEAPRDRWRRCPRCQERLAAEGLPDEDALQSWFIARMARWLEARGRRLVGWDEILAGGLAPGATVHSWRGFAGAVAAARQGHDTVVSPTSHAYFDYDPGVTDLAAVYAFEPVPPELAAAEAAHVLGGQANLWTEYAPQGVLDERLFPRLCAMAEVLWSPAPLHADRAGPDVKDPHVVGRDLADFWTRLQALGRRLERIGVRMGPAARPLEVAAVWDPSGPGWRVSWEVTAVVPPGELAVAVSRSGGAAPAEALRPPAGSLDIPLHDDDAGAGLSLQLRIDGQPYGAPVHLAMQANHALDGSHLARPRPSARYTPVVARPVTDGVVPDGDYRDGRWLAWEGEDAQLDLDLGAAAPITRVTAITLHAGAALIQAPERVVVETSADGRIWRRLGAARWQIAGEVMARVVAEYPVEAAEPVTARWVRLSLDQRTEPPVWPWAAEYPPWIFLGQVLVE